MNHSIFWRLLWKEYRLQRALWIAMFALAIVAQAGCFAMMAPQDRPLFLFWTASGLPAFYFLGCGAMSFAGEHEAGTYEFQRALPVKAWCVLAAKMAASIVGMLVMLGGTWLLAFALSGWTFHSPQGSSPLAVLIVLGFLGLELFLWATLLSLLSRRVLVAAILGVAAASVSVQIAGQYYWLYWQAIPQRAVVAALVALADCWLGIRWFRETTDRRVRSARRGLETAASAQSMQPSAAFRRPERMAILGRLVWQHARQSIGTMLAVSTTIVLLAIVPAGVLYAAPPYASYQWSKPLYALALACVPLLGVCTFLADQRGRSFRALADRGVPPRYVWLSRQ